MWKKSFLSKEGIYKLIVINVFIIVFLNIFLFFTSIDYIAYSLIQYSLIIWILSFTTLYYQQYNNKTLLKRMGIENKSKQKLQLNLFLIVFFWGVIIILLSLFYIYIFSFIEMAHQNITGEINIEKPILWIYFPFLMYFYVSFYQLFVLIALSYFLNHFIKNKTFMMGTIIVIFAYSFFFGFLFANFTFLNKEEEFSYISFKSNIAINKMIINTFIAPWTNINILGHQVFLVKENIQIKWFHQTYSDTFFLKNYFYFPYIFILIYIFIPKLHSKIFN